MSNRSQKLKGCPEKDISDSKVDEVKFILFANVKIPRSNILSDPVQCFL